MKIQQKMIYIILFIFLLVSFPLQAADNKDVMTYRNRVMGGIGSNSGSIGDILKGKVEYSNLIVNYAKSLHESAKTVATVFKQDTRGTDKKTRAKDEIWENWADFEKKADALVKASADFVTAAETGDMAKIGAAMKTLGGACGDCHKANRKKK